LGNAILNAQKNALKTSPYIDAKRFHVPKAQIQFRLTKFPKLISDLISDKTKLTDTLWIVESFDEMFPTSSSYSSDILYHGSLYTNYGLSSDSVNKTKFRLIPFDKHLNSYHYIISEVVDSIREKKKWLSSPLAYGANNCADGDHTIVTIVYPDLHIESLYVRCWTEPNYRTRQ
jgi:hypothetical protein